MGVMTAAMDDGTATAVLLADGKICSANPNFHSLFGGLNGAGQVFGQNIASVISGAAEGEVEAILALARARGGGADGVERLLEGRTAKGALFPMSCIFQSNDAPPLKAGDPAAAPYLHGRESSGGGVNLKVLPLNDSVGMITIEEDGTICSANSFVSRLFGWKPAEELASGMNVAQLMPRPCARSPLRPTGLRISRNNRTL